MSGPRFVRMADVRGDTAWNVAPVQTLLGDPQRRRKQSLRDDASEEMPMTPKVSFRWLLTLFALIAPAALGPYRVAGKPEDSPAQQEASSDVVFRHYL